MYSLPQHVLEAFEQGSYQEVLAELRGTALPTYVNDDSQPLPTSKERTEAAFVYATMVICEFRTGKLDGISREVGGAYWDLLPSTGQEVIDLSLSFFQQGEAGLLGSAKLWNWRRNLAQHRSGRAIMFEAAIELIRQEEYAAAQAVAILLPDGQRNVVDALQETLDTAMLSNKQREMLTRPTTHPLVTELIATLPQQIVHIQILKGTVEVVGRESVQDKKSNVSLVSQALVLARLAKGQTPCTAADLHTEVLPGAQSEQYVAQVIYALRNQLGKELILNEKSRGYFLARHVRVDTDLDHLAKQAEFQPLKTLATLDTEVSDTLTAPFVSQWIERIARRAIHHLNEKEHDRAMDHLVSLSDRVVKLADTATRLTRKDKTGAEDSN